MIFDDQIALNYRIMIFCEKGVKMAVLIVISTICHIY
jgi:hypothetical protein